MAESTVRAGSRASVGWWDWNRACHSTGRAWAIRVGSRQRRERLEKDVLDSGQGRLYTSFDRCLSRTGRLMDPSKWHQAIEMLSVASPPESSRPVARPGPSVGFSTQSGLDVRSPQPPQLRPRICARISTARWGLEEDAHPPLHSTYPVHAASLPGSPSPRSAAGLAPAGYKGIRACYGSNDGHANPARQEP